MKISIQSHDEPGTVVLDTDMINQLTRGSIIDAPISLLRADPPLWLLPTAMQQNGDIYLSHTAVKGYFDDLSDAEYCVIDEHELFAYPPHLDESTCGRHWITKLIHVDGGTLAFLHSEYTGEGDFFGMPSAIINGNEVRAPGRSAIGLAWLPHEELENESLQFTYLGHIAGYSGNMPHFNVSGTPAFVNQVDGVEYINILFSDLNSTRTADGWTKDRVYVSQARAPLAEVVEQAKKGQSTKWLKRVGDEWDDALGSRSSSVLPRVARHEDPRVQSGDVIVHSDAIWVDEIDRFILVGYELNHRKHHPSCLVVYSSADGLNWEFETTSNPRSDCLSGWSYVTLLNNGRRDGSNGLYALVGWDYGKPNRSVYRLGIEISDA